MSVDPSSERQLYAEMFEHCCNGQVLEVKHTRQPVMNGYPAGVAIVTHKTYECRDCHRQLKQLEPA